jgi:hypothetical protein
VYLQFFFSDCWDNEPDNRPIINEVIAKLNAIISNKKLIIKNFQSNDNYNALIQQPHNNSSLSQVTNNNKVILPENNFSVAVVEIIILLDDIPRQEVKKATINNYFNRHNINSQEIYDWLLNNQNNSNSVVLLGIFNHYGIVINVTNKQKAFEFYQKLQI